MSFNDCCYVYKTSNGITKWIGSDLVLIELQVKLKCYIKTGFKNKIQYFPGVELYDDSLL
jgi:hypothetical protein